MKQRIELGQRVYFDDWPPEPVRQAWCEWLEFHTVDPCRVVVPGWVERHEGDRQIRYRALKLDDNGEPLIAASGDDFEYVTEVVQLEAPPRPFPDVTGTAA